MKKVNKLFFLILLFFFSNKVNSQKLSYIDDFLLENTIEEKNLNSFFYLLDKSCKNGFLDNLQKHRSYPNLGNKKNWEKICNKLEKKTNLNIDFIRNHFSIKTYSNKKGLLTGYYEPLIMVSRKKTKKFSVPLLKYNNNYNGQERKEIELSYNQSDVLLWTNDKVDLFFLQIQGSGIGVLNNNQKIKIIYGGNNKLEYRSIGKLLLKKKVLKKINLFTIKDYLYNNPDKIEEILNFNKRYIFFKIDEKNIVGNPVGAFGLSLKPNLSAAVDKKFYPLGFPLLLKINSNKINPVISMDRGAAILGSNRADLFYGRGKKAEKIAGVIKKKLLIYLLVPKEKNVK